MRKSDKFTSATHTLAKYIDLDRFLGQP